MSAKQKSKPEPYRGPLTPQTAAIGIKAAKENAKRLLDDAQLLLDERRFPSACALAALSIEEVCKPALIRKLLIAESPEQVRKGWQLFASHHDKAAPWLVPSVIASQPETYEDFVEHFMRTRDPILLDSLKQLSIYLGCYGACHWAAPIEVIEREQTDAVISSARILILSSQLSELDSAAGLVLWQTHMEGCFSVGYVTANNMIVQFFPKAHSEGLLKDSRIPPSVAFDFMSTALVLSDGEAAEQELMYGIPHL
jgi:AbiV family abortive infection protein